MDKLGPLIPFLFLIAVFWFFVIRPARSRQAQAQAVVSRLAPGQRVMTTAGLFGSISAVDGDEIDLEIAPGVHVRYMAAAIARVIDDPASPSTGSGDASANGEGTADDLRSSSLQDDTPGT